MSTGEAGYMCHENLLQGTLAKKLQTQEDIFYSN